MGLAETVNNVFRAAKEHVFIPDTKKSVKQHLREKHLKTYFSGLDEKQNDRYMQLLEQNVDKSFDKYKRNIESTVARFGTGVGVATGLAEIMDVALGMPASYTAGATATIILGKTAVELPQLYTYLKNTKDINGLYGMAMYSLRKMAGLAIPFVGPMVEGGSLKAMFADRILHEAKLGFLKDIGKYESLYARIKNRVLSIAGIAKNPAETNAYTPAYRAA
jgi:hypothetical protein